MPQSLVQIYVHLVFSTKNRQPFLEDKAFRERVHAYLLAICEPDKDSRNENEQPNVLPYVTLSDKKREAAEGDERGAGGSRTHEWRFCKPQTNPENARENGVPCLPASKSPAVTAEISQDLQAIIDAWPALPDAIKAGILAMVTAASQAAG